MFRKLPTTSFLLVALALPAQESAAAAPSPMASTPPRLTVGYVDGRVTQVELLELRDGKVRVRSFLYGGSMVHVTKLDQFEPLSRYRMVVALSPPATFAEHFAMAKLAGEWRLLDQTAQHLRSALATLGDEAEAKAQQDEVRSWAAAWLETIVGESLAAGNVREAERRLGILCSRLADRCSEERIEELARQVDTVRTQQEEERSRARLARLQERDRADLSGRLKPIQALVETGDRRMRDAMRHARRTVQTTRLAGSAIDAYRAAWEEAQQLARRFPGQEDLVAELGDLAIALQERSVKAALHVANSLTFQSDFRGAMNWVDRALEFDPDHGEAKELRRTILVASAAAGGWGWMNSPDSARLR